MIIVRRLLLPLLLLALATPASGSTSVGRQGFLAASWTLHSGSRRVQVELVAAEEGLGQGLPSRLHLDLTSCDPGGHCRRLARVALQLPADAVVVDPLLNTATLKTRVAGLAFDVALSHTSVDPKSSSIYTPGATIYELDTDSGGPNPRFDVVQAGSGTASIGGASCPVEGEIGTYQGLDQTGDEVRDPRPTTLRLSRADLRALLAARC